MAPTDTYSISLTLAEYDLILNALSFSEKTYDALAEKIPENSYALLGETYFELRTKIELTLEACALMKSAGNSV